MPCEAKQRLFWDRLSEWLTLGRSPRDEMEVASPFFRSDEAELLAARLARLEWIAGLSAIWFLVLSWQWGNAPAGGAESAAFWVVLGRAALIVSWVVWPLWRSVSSARIRLAGQFGWLNGPRSLSGLQVLGPPTVLLTGGWSSPAFLLLCIIVIHHIEYPRHLRFMTLALLGITAFTTVFPWYDPLTRELSWNAALRQYGFFGAISTGVPFFFVVAHSLYCVERVRPPLTALMPSSTSGFGYDPDHSNLYVSLLVRAMKLYRADGGLVVMARKKLEDGMPPDFEARHAVTWPLVDRLLSAVSEDGPRAVAISSDRPELDWLTPLLAKALQCRSARCSGIPHGTAEFASVIVFRIGPQLEPHDQPFFVLASRRKRAFWAPITTVTGIFWSQALQMLESAFLEAAWRRVIRAGDNRASLEKALKTECENFAPMVLRPLKIVIASRRRSEPVHYLRSAQHRQMGADRLVSACTFSVVGNDSLQVADVYVLAEIPGKLLDVKGVALSRSRTLINEFLADVFRGPIVSKLLQRDSLVDEEEGWALLEFGSRDEERLRKLPDLPAAKEYEKEFEGYGFRVLAVNAIMKAWMPWLKEDSGDEICWKRYLRDTSQGCACHSCPIIRNLHFFFHPSSGKPSGPAPAPAMIGSKLITRHFYLSCELLKDPLDEKQISSVVEHVEDRTVYFEKNRLARYLQSHFAAEDILHDRGEVFQRLAEGLGRVFHADSIKVVSLGQEDCGEVLFCFQRSGFGTGNSSAAIEPCRGALERQKQESEVLVKLRKAVTPRAYLDEMENLPRLYSRADRSYRPLTRAQMAGVSAMVIESRTNRAASESTLKDDGCWLGEFDREVFRMLVIEVPFARTAVLVCTGRPEDWEYQEWNSASGVLRTRSFELEAAYEMAENVGAKLRGNDSNYLAYVRDIRGFISHEMSHVTDELEQTGQLLKWFDLPRLKQLSSVFCSSQVRLKGFPIWEWLEHIGQLSAHGRAMERENLDRLYAEFDAVLGDRRATRLLAPLIDLGLVPEGLPRLNEIREIAGEDRLRVVELLRSYHDVTTAVELLKQAKRYADQIFFGGWSPVDEKKVDIRSMVDDVLKTLRLSEYISLEAYIEPGAVTQLNRSLLEPMVMNLLRNAIDAATSLRRSARVVVACAVRDPGDWPFLQIANDGSEMPEDVLANLFLRSSKVGVRLGEAGSGTGMPAASHFASLLGGWLKYEFKPAFGSKRDLHVFTFLPSGMSTIPTK